MFDWVNNRTYYFQKSIIVTYYIDIDINFVLSYFVFRRMTSLDIIR